MDLQQILVVGKAVFYGAVAIGSVIVDFVEKHKDSISKIVLRVEKDSQDGWTNEEKEQFAVDMYFKEIVPTLPVRTRLFLAIIPDSWEESMIRKSIKKLCEKTAKLPEIVKQAATPVPAADQPK
jgi:hypothetical protein